MSEPSVTATGLELEVGAAVASLAAWCWPSDFEQRVCAEQASALCGVDYVESIARIMTSTNADANTARRIVADGFLQRVGKLVNTGHAPRMGVGACGNQLDSTGYPNVDLDADTEEV